MAGCGCIIHSLGWAGGSASKRIHSLDGRLMLLVGWGALVLPEALTLQVLSSLSSLSSWWLGRGVEERRKGYRGRGQERKARKQECFQDISQRFL